MIPKFKTPDTVSNLKDGDTAYIYEWDIIVDVNEQCYISPKAYLSSLGGYESADIRIIKSKNGIVADTSIHLNATDEQLLFENLRKKRKDLTDEERKYPIIKWITKLEQDNV